MNLRKKLSLAACLLALIFTFAGSPVAPARAQVAAAADDAAAEYVPVADESFVLYQNEAGETVCRPATAAERERIRQADGTHVIYPGAPRRRSVIDGQELLMQNSVEDSTGLALLPSAGLTIVLQGTAQLEANPTAKNAFIAAANRWESIISTPVTITLSVDYGPNFFDQGPYPDPGILGQTGSFIIRSNGQDPTLSSVRTRLVNTAATQAEAALYNALPTSSVPAEFNGNTVQVSNVRVNTSQARALGFNVAPGTDAQIGFNSDFANGGKFDFDPSDGITAGFHDFDAAAAHEIGHALGFASANGGSSSAALTIWDLFRFRPSTANAGNFGSALRVLTKGGTQVMFGDFTNTFATQELGLSTGGPNPPDGDTDDGRQSSHWKADELSSTRPYIGVMDPTLSRGLRRTITENDVRALELIGYSVVFNPTRPANDNFDAATGLAGASGSVTGTSQWATRQVGEPSMQAGFQGDKSVWFNWTAPTTGTATFDTVGSGFDTTLGIYTGALGTLAPLDQNDDVAGLAGGASRITFNTVAGTVYRIDVDGWNGEYGNVQLNWTSSGTQPTPTPTPTPAPAPQFFNVTGRVTDAAGNGIGGVRIGLSSAAFNTTAHPLFTTDSNGNFSIPALSVGTVYTISPIRDGQFAFSPGPATFSGAGADMVFNFTASAGNPIDGSTRFVEQHYQDFLGRTADASGLAFWTGEIESCAGNLACREVKRINVSAAFFQSIEFQNTGYLVERMYKTAYGDRTEASTGLVVPIITRQEFVQDTPLISAGVVVNFGNWQAQLEANKVAYALAFVQRARFVAAYPATLTPAQFVARLNQNTGGALSQAQENALAAELALNNTDAGRAVALRKVAESAELDAREKNRAFVLMEYFGYLRRNPSDAPERDLNYAGWNFWLGKLNEFNGNFVAAEMVKAFLDSSEYRGRFGP